MLGYNGNKLIPERTKKCIAKEMTLVLSLRCPLNKADFYATSQESRTLS